MPDRSQVAIQFVYEGVAGGDVEVCDLIVRNTVEVFDQGAEAVSMCSDQDRQPSPEIL